MSWKVGSAKQRFSEVLRKAAEAPQPIHNRERLVATVIGPEDSRLFLKWRRLRRAPMSEALEEARRIATEENYEMLIAATALEHNLALATRNTKDFEVCGIPLVNPFERTP